MSIIAKAKRDECQAHTFDCGVIKPSRAIHGVASNFASWTGQKKLLSSLNEDTFTVWIF